MALKTGSEDKKKVIAVAVLGVVVLGLVIYNIAGLFGGSSTPPAPASSPGATTGSVSPPGGTGTGARVIPAKGGPEAKKVPGSIASLDPTLHPEVMEAAESLEYSGEGRNIFSMSSAPVIEPLKADIRPKPVVPQPPPGPPPPPPIDLKFFGYESHQGGGKKVFLLHGDDVFIAAEGDVVDHHYKVVKIAPLSVQVEDIPYHNTQTLPLVQN